MSLDFYDEAAPIDQATFDALKPQEKHVTTVDENAMHMGLPVHGYKPQSTEKVKSVNRMKQMEEMILRVLDSMRLDPEIDQRWLQIGRTDLEKGFMGINRSIFAPGRVELPDDNDPADMFQNKADT